MSDEEYELAVNSAGVVGWETFLRARPNPLRHTAWSRLGRHAEALGSRNSHSPHHRQRRAGLRHGRAELHLPAVRSMCPKVETVFGRIHQCEINKGHDFWFAGSLSLLSSLTSNSNHHLEMRVRRTLWNTSKMVCGHQPPCKCQRVPPSRIRPMIDRELTQEGKVFFPDRYTTSDPRGRFGCPSSFIRVFS